MAQPERNWQTLGKNLLVMRKLTGWWCFHLIYLAKNTKPFWGTKFFFNCCNFSLYTSTWLPCRLLVREGLLFPHPTPHRLSKNWVKAWLVPSIDLFWNFENFFQPKWLPLSVNAAWDYFQLTCGDHWMINCLALKYTFGNSNNSRMKYTFWKELAEKLCCSKW